MQYKYITLEQTNKQLTGDGNCMKTDFPKTLEGKVEIKGLLKSKGKGFWLYTGQNTKKTCSDKLSRHIFHPAQNLTSIFI